MAGFHTHGDMIIFYVNTQLNLSNKYGGMYYQPILLVLISHYHRLY